jgi:hypothetical protein
MAESHALSKPIFETRCSHPWKSGIAGCNSFLQRESKQQRGFENLMHALRILPLAGFLALIAALPPAVPAQSASFQVAQHGHAVGTASFRFTATPDGYDSTSLVRVAMQGLDYALSKNEQLSSANQLEHALLSATVNGEAVNVVAAPDSAQLLLNISASGHSSTTRLAAHPGAVFLPDFDPGALETLLVLAVTQNNHDLWAILPKNAGSIEQVQVATYADQQGTLDGKPIAVHHIVATIAGASTDLFSGPENQLLQAELPQEGFALIRNGFVLKPPAKPIVPPEGVAAAPQP